MPATIVGLFVAGILLEWVHPLRQWRGYHDFADTRAWLGIPNAADVLSNVPIFLAGLALVVKISRAQGLASPGLVVAGVGLMFTGIGSAYYHLAPSDATLIWDRLPLATVFAGALLAAWACSGMRPPTAADAAFVVAASFASVAYWIWLGSLWPYAILQFGALAALLSLAARNRLVPAKAWWLLILFYALAKVFEMLDRPVWDLTRQVVSGHTLKHLASAAAGSCFLWIAAQGPAPATADHASLSGLKEREAHQP